MSVVECGARSATFSIGGELTVNRLGLGAIHLTGPGSWGDPRDPDGAVRVLRRAVELGVNFIDTANAYGPGVSERLIRSALHPYPSDLVIATKVGQIRAGPDVWLASGRPEQLRAQTEDSLRNLGVERLDLLQLHRVDPAVPLAESLGELGRLQAEGKVGHIGVSEVSVAQLAVARGVVTVASVQNRFNLTDRSSQDVLDAADAAGIAFIPWFPLASSALTRRGGRLARVAKPHRATTAQVALAWLLAYSPVVVPIPGTSQLVHLEENMAAFDVELTAAELASLTARPISASPRLRPVLGKLKRRLQR